MRKQWVVVDYFQFNFVTFSSNNIYLTCMNEIFVRYHGKFIHKLHMTLHGIPYILLVFICIKRDPYHIMCIALRSSESMSSRLGHLEPRDVVELQHLQHFFGVRIHLNNVMLKSWHFWNVVISTFSLFFLKFYWNTSHLAVSQPLHKMSNKPVNKFSIMFNIIFAVEQR